jgi:fluoroquinolone resistance protein
METVFIEDKTFDKSNFTRVSLQKGEYENCTFINCDFSNTDLTELRFVDCEFLGCNLSLVNLTKTALRDIKFKDSKMLGLHFENCSQFGLSFSFDNCNLTHSSFFQTKIRKTISAKSQLHEADFAECDLTSCVFDNCDLTRAIFENTIIEKTDFRTSFNYSIDPEINRIKKAKFSLTGIIGLLEKYDIEIDMTN